MRATFKKALGRVQSLTDSAMDGELEEMAKAKMPPESEGVEQQEGVQLDLTPEELEKLKAMLSEG